VQTLECPNCGAPLDHLPVEEDVECPYCGTRFAHPEARQIVVDVRGLDDASRGARKVVPFLIGIPIAAALFGLAIALGGGWIAWHATSRATHGVQQSVRSLVLGATKSAAPLTLATLADWEDFGRKPLALAPPPGGFAAFDAVSNLPWAVTVAQAWRRDATIDRIDVTRLRPDGTVNVEDDRDAEVMYRFLSPSRIEQYKRDRDMRADAETTYEFWVVAKGGGVAVQTIKGRPTVSHDPNASLTPPYPNASSLRSIVGAAAAERGWIAKPFYEGYMIYLPSEGWVWYLSTLGRESEPRVRARDGRRSY
jgi:hypothetical protein